MNTTKIPGRRARFPFLAAAVAGALFIGGGELLAQTTPAPQPTICVRSCWNATSNGLSSTIGLNRAIIHHTAGTYGNVSLSHSKDIVRNIQAYHKSLGWGDIGYHFLTDALGNIFQGRYGSMTLGTYYRGAHDGTNSNSYGYSALGNYENNTFTTAGRNAMWDVIAWKMPSGWSPYGAGTYNSRTVGYTDGHRSVKATACPGSNIWATIGTNYSGGTARNAIAARRTPDSTLDRLDIVVRGSSNRVYRKRYIEGSSWGNWIDMGGSAKQRPAIATRDDPNRRIDVLIRSSSDTLQWRRWTPSGGWTGWNNGGGNLRSSPGAVSYDGGKLYVVARGTNDEVMKTIIHPNNTIDSWNSTYHSGVTTTSAPTIAAPSDNRMDLFARSGSSLRHRYWVKGSSWSNWRNAGGSVSGAPSAVGFRGDEAYCVVRGSGGDVVRVRVNGSFNFSSWTSLGGSGSQAPAVGSWDGEMLYVVERLSNGDLQRRMFTAGDGWGSWGHSSTLGGAGLTLSTPEVAGMRW